MANVAIEVKELNKTYSDKFIALNSISISITEGIVYGILGPNGAGKTTLISVLSGLLNKTSGFVSVFGANIENLDRKKLQAKIGVAPQEIALYEMLTPIENLEYFATMYGINKKDFLVRSQELLQQFGLWEVRNKPVKKFSGGMKRRLNLITALIHKPQLLFLDEPTEGIDVQSRSAILEYLKNLNKTEKTTIIYTSHLLAEAENLCHEVLIMDKGEKIVHGKTGELIGNSGKNLQDVFLQLTGSQYRDLRE